MRSSSHQWHSRGSSPRDTERTHMHRVWPTLLPRYTTPAQRSYTINSLHLQSRSHRREGEAIKQITVWQHTVTISATFLPKIFNQMSVVFIRVIALSQCPFFIARYICSRRVSVYGLCLSQVGVLLKRLNVQTIPHDSAGTLVFWRQRSPRNSTGVTPYGGTKCRWGESKSALYRMATLRLTLTAPPFLRDISKGVEI